MAAVAVPLLRRRAKLSAASTICSAALGPFAICLLTPRSRARDVAVCSFQMWAYVVTYKMPADDLERLERRARIDYPIALDCILGAGKTPTVRLQQAFGSAGRINGIEKLLVWTHWVWFFVPHATVGYMLLRHRQRFPRAACLIYGTFDLGLVGYWVIPTAPPWYASTKGHMHDGHTPELRRMMVEYGEQFWRRYWEPLYGLLGGNPYAAMPSLHCATSVMAAHLLSETGPIAGAIGWGYAGTLAIALVYLAEHYVIDLVAGVALAEAIRRLAPKMSPQAERISAAVRWLEGQAA